MLQAFAFDPSLELDIAVARVNRTVIDVRWEEGLAEGPVGEYLEVVDIDPASQSAYAPVNLDHPHILATSGLAPSEGNPQFHQQMVYAVAMKTIANFEEALGRSIHWSPHRVPGNAYEEHYVPRLRIYPHALREANAYYSPDKKALLFGYFNALNADAQAGLPGGLVFSCLSHDIIAHEMTHAILDGIHRRMLEPTNVDTLAFHEAFADLIAIFQHFTLTGVLENQIAQTRGNLASDSLLSKLAVQFGHATQHGGALRDVLMEVNEAGEPCTKSPDPDLIHRTTEPHARGAILVAAFFHAFLAIYKVHTDDLLRLASGGTGTLAPGALHPDLVKRLAREANDVAQRFLVICVRAVDYLAPVDVTFGDYLRALITSDLDIGNEDRRRYRNAIIRAFRDWGIYPHDVRTLSIESLVWDGPQPHDQELFKRLLPPMPGLRLLAFADGYSSQCEKILDNWEDQSVEEVTRALIQHYTAESPRCEEPNAARRSEWHRFQQFARYVHKSIGRNAKTFTVDERPLLGEALGVDLFDSDRRFEVHAVRPILRVRPDGRTAYELLILITQRTIAHLGGKYSEMGYRFRSGCTLLIDPMTGDVRYAIVKRGNGVQRKSRVQAYLEASLDREGLVARARYGVWLPSERKAADQSRQEPFRLLHESNGGDQWP